MSKRKTNEEAAELYAILNRAKYIEGSHAEYAGMKTLHKMYAWYKGFTEKLADIDDINCATYKDDRGAEILLRETLTRTNKDGSKEEFKSNMYTPSGQKTRMTARRDFLKAQVSIDFEIHSTHDSSPFSAYEKLVLQELGFLTAEQKENDTTMPPPTTDTAQL